MNLLLIIITALFLMSLISFFGVSALVVRKDLLKKILSLLVAFSAGSLLATAFLELIPEGYEQTSSLLFVIIGIMLFFAIESVIHWHHSHNSDEDGHFHKLHPSVYLSLIGDAVHNFVDGAIIAASFLISIPSGIATTIAIAAHEIPQEFGDFAVLISGGLKVGRALLLNFLSAVFAVLGGITSYFLLSKLSYFIPFVNLIAAGGLIYIATADLFPKLHEEKDYRKVLLQALGIILGILVIWILVTFMVE